MEPPNDPPAFRLTRDHRVALLILFSASICLLLTVFMTRIPSDDLGDWSEAFGNVGTFIVSLLVAIAAFWWWRLQGSGFPRLRVTQSVRIVASNSVHTTLYVSAHLENVGQVSVILSKWCLWAVDVSSFPEGVENQLECQPARACQDYRLPWKASAGAEFDLPEPHGPQIRPGELQDLGAFVRLPVTARLIRVYSYFPHASLGSGNFGHGWTSITIVELPER